MYRQGLIIIEMFSFLLVFFLMTHFFLSHYDKVFLSLVRYRRAADSTVASAAGNFEDDIGLSPHNKGGMDQYVKERLNVVDKYSRNHSRTSKEQVARPIYTMAERDKNFRLYFFNIQKNRV